ncbi:MAG TPA: hypothetical protein VD902_08130, partial [Symbiobacteriaceae bacterium]|nr:hypothetical protein [Symbiobacteriaceae bacterium]
LYMGAVGAPFWFLTGWFARAVLGTMQMSLFSAFAMGVTPEPERATANSYALLGRNLGQAAAAAVYGATLTAGNYLITFGLSGILALGAAAFVLAVFRRQAMVDADSIGA